MGVTPHAITMVEAKDGSLVYEREVSTGRLVQQDVGEILVIDIVERAHVAGGHIERAHQRVFHHQRNAHQ